MRVRDHDYVVRSLPITTQFSLSAKLAPVVALMSLQSDRAELRRTFPKSFTALCETMSVQDQQWVLDTCLGCVLRTEPGMPPAPAWIGGMPAFQDIDMGTMLELVWEVIEHHKIIDFFSVDPSRSTAPRDDQTTSSGSGSQKDAAG
jgi:hypothetical protein